MAEYCAAGVAAGGAAIPGESKRRSSAYVASTGSTALAWQAIELPTASTLASYQYCAREKVGARWVVQCCQGSCYATA